MTHHYAARPWFVRWSTTVMALGALSLWGVSPSQSSNSSPSLNAAATAGASMPNPNCSLIVPRYPLSAAGLSTPYRLVATDPAEGPCSEANPAQSAFVQAAIFDPRNGEIVLYSPLVIDQGSEPAAPPAVPALPPDAVVAIWFGYNGDQLTLSPSMPGALAEGRCVNGVRGSVFDQFAYCNAREFFAAANSAVAKGLTVVPPLGTAIDGKPCPSVRDFAIVDQDQSDNLPTVYLVTAEGRTAQYTQRNRTLLKGARTLANPSDNRLLDQFVDRALGCHSWTVQDLTDPGQKAAGLALNELQARSEQPPPIALIPLGDPMVRLNGRASLAKLNLYRDGVDQPTALSNSDAATARYCRHLLRIAPARLHHNREAFSSFESPDTDAANSLYTFLAQRFVATYSILECESLTSRPDPVAVATDSRGVATSAQIDLVSLQTSIQLLAAEQAPDDTLDSLARAP